MAKPRDEIISDIQGHFNGKSYGGCYIGVAENARERLFDEHNVDKENGHWIFNTAYSSNVAREVEDFFLEKGMDGGDGGGSQASNMVYAYQKTIKTSP